MFYLRPRVYVCVRARSEADKVVDPGGGSTLTSQGNQDSSSHISSASASASAAASIVATPNMALAVNVRVRFQLVEPLALSTAECGSSTAANATVGSGWPSHLADPQPGPGPSGGDSAPCEPAGMAGLTCSTGTASEIDAREGGKEGKLHTLADVEQQVGVLRQMMDAQARKDSEEIAKLGQQFVSACRLIQTLKVQAEELASENCALKETPRAQAGQNSNQEVSKLQAQVSQLQAQINAAAKSTNTECEFCSKRLKGAKDQMARVMAMHAKERAAWSRTESELKAEVQLDKAAEEELRNKLGESRNQLGIIRKEVISLLCPWCVFLL